MRKPSRRAAPRRLGDRSGRDPAARARSKRLLKEAGEALERGDLAAGREHLEAALGADPAFVEPALTLAAVCAERDEAARADELVDEAIRRARAQVARIPEKPGGPAWWRDEATRPLMKALVARGFRCLARGDAAAAALQFEEVFDLDPDDPLEAGVYTAEAHLRAGDPMAALGMFARLEEQPAVLYGRALALFATAQPREAIVSLWLGLLINGQVAEELLGPALPGRGAERLVGDLDEAREIVSRTADLWTAELLRLLGQVREDEGFRREAGLWAAHIQELDAAEGEAANLAALSAIERFLDADRVAGEALGCLGRIGPAIGGPRRLPLA